MHPLLKSALVIGKAVVFAGLSFVLYKQASKAAWQAGGEAMGLFARMMTADETMTFADVVEGATVSVHAAT